jgi:glycosyltransferase involved in cell wall biosynthesis
MILGIDASHVIGGGALRHLKLLLDNLNYSTKKFSKIYIWASHETLNSLDKNKKIIKCHKKILEFNFILKALWQIFFLKKELKKFNCNILFVPTGIFYTNFRPVVTMAQNLMPFNNEIVNKHFPSLLFFKMLLQKYLFIRSFYKANAVIYLSKYSKNYINFFLKNSKNKKRIIPHAIDLKLINFFKKKKIPKNLKTKKIIKICLLSDVNFNKNYENVLKAISLIKKNYNIQLFWIGNYNPILIREFNKLVNILNEPKKYIFYKGLFSHSKAMSFLKKSDIFLYTSYCETFGVAVLEGMCSKLPIVILKHPLYKEILGNNAFFFRNNNVEDLKLKIILAIEKSFSYQKFSKKNIQLLLSKYNPKQMSLNTFQILADTFIEYSYRNKISK